MSTAKIALIVSSVLCSASSFSQDLNSNFARDPGQAIFFCYALAVVGLSRSAAISKIWIGKQTP